MSRLSKGYKVSADLQKKSECVVIAYEVDYILLILCSSFFQASSKYMNCFLSPLLTVVAKNVAFFAGSLLAVLIALTIYDEDVLAVEHVLSSITLLGVCITICR